MVRPGRSRGLYHYVIVGLVMVAVALGGYAALSSPRDATAGHRPLDLAGDGQSEVAPASGVGFVAPAGNPGPTPAGLAQIEVEMEQLGAQISDLNGQGAPDRQQMDAAIEGTLQAMMETVHVLMSAAEAQPAPVTAPAPPTAPSTAPFHGS